MAESKEELLAFIAEEVKKYKGVMIPQKATMIERFKIVDIPIEKLHPNPEDEFCIESIGPSFTIIKSYEDEMIKRLPFSDMDLFDEPLYVEKMHPDGYLILNGHHRWAAARQIGIKKVPIHIVNPTHESDIKKMIGDSTRSRRVVFDLDEVVFSAEGDFFEQKPGTFLGKRFKENIRLGTPALFHFFNSQGYDVWVFSSKFYSLDHIKSLFKQYSVQVDGIVTGAKNKGNSNSGERQRIRQMLEQKYKETVNVDGESVVRIMSEDKDFEQFEIKEKGQGWSAEIMDIVKAWPKSESAT